MSSNCPDAPRFPTALIVKTTILKAGKGLVRCHKGSYAANSFNPNVGMRMAIPEEGARFNPFPGPSPANIPTLYAADSLQAAALESIFHDVPHVPSPKYPQVGLLEWSYSKLQTTRDFVLFELINPKLRTLSVPGRANSITEEELIHSQPSEYPHTRTWAQSLHDVIPNLDGLAWRPRLAGMGISYVFFGDRVKSGDLRIVSPPISAAIPPGFLDIFAIANTASIVIVRP